MDNKSMLSDEELDQVVGGTIKHNGQEYDSLQLLDAYIDALQGGDFSELLNTSAIIGTDLSTFLADVQKAGREIPKELQEHFGLSM